MKYTKYTTKLKKTREKINKENKIYDKLETTSIIEGIKKNEALRMRESNMDEESNSLTVNDAFTKFTKTNYMKGREPKIHMRISSPVENENEENKSNLNDKKMQIKPIDEIQEFIFPRFDDVDMNSSNIEEFLSKHWIELMDVCYGLISEIFLKIGNIQVSEEVFKLFNYIQSWSNKNISQYIYDRLFSRQKLSLDQYWFK